MPSLLDPPTESPTTAAMSQAAAERLRSLMAAVRLSFIWFGVKKTLTQEQKSQAADTFGAEGDYLSAAKKLLDTSHPAFRAVIQRREPHHCLLARHLAALPRTRHPADPPGRHSHFHRSADHAPGRVSRGGGGPRVANTRS